MTGRIAPSTRLALYAAAVLAVYLIPGVRLATLVATALLVVILAVIARSPRRVPAGRWRTILLFVAWVFVMRLGLDLVTGIPVDDAAMWLAATRQAARVAVLGIGVLALIATTTARDVVDELEYSRLPRSARLLVMMIVQYPRVLRDRFDQIVEAQVARGADRPRSVLQRVSHGAALLMPVMQSELNAVGDRAGLIHLRGLDVEVPRREGVSPRSATDAAALCLAALVVVSAVVMRLLG